MLETSTVGELILKYLVVFRLFLAYCMSMSNIKEPFQNMCTYVFWNWGKTIIEQDMKTQVSFD